VAQEPEARPVSAGPALAPVQGLVPARSPAATLVSRTPARRALGAGSAWSAQHSRGTLHAPVLHSSQAGRPGPVRLMVAQHPAAAQASRAPLSCSARLAPAVSWPVRCFARYAARQRVHRTSGDRQPRARPRPASVTTTVAVGLAPAFLSRTGEGCSCVLLATSSSRTVPSCLTRNTELFGLFQWIESCPRGEQGARPADRSPKMR